MNKILEIEIGYIGGGGMMGPVWEPIKSLYVKKDIVEPFLKYHTYYPVNHYYSQHFRIKPSSMYYNPRHEMVMLVHYTPIEIKGRLDAISNY